VRRFRETIRSRPLLAGLLQLYGRGRARATELRNRIKYGSFDFFNDLNIEVNTSCNRRCSYCPNSVFERGLISNEKLMDEDLFRKVIDDLAEIDFDGRISPHFYGEPLLHPKLTELVAYVRDRLPKAQVVIVSNGDSLNVARYEELAAAGVDSFQITEHGRAPKPGMAELLETYARAPGRATIEYTKFTEETPLHNRGGLVEPNTVSHEPRCAQPRNPLVVDWQGQVVLCCNDYQSEVVFGNVRDQNLIDIWHSPEFVRVRRELREGTYRLPICRRCVGLDPAE
jgi:radical SAM protein with 4Fe4S-binding SPASM domain